jgi:hypothetical protein
MLRKSLPRHYCILNTHPEHGNVFTFAWGVPAQSLSNANMRLITVILVGVLPLVARAAELKPIGAHGIAPQRQQSALIRSRRSPESKVDSSRIK